MLPIFIPCSVAFMKIQTIKFSFYYFYVFLNISTHYGIFLYLSIQNDCLIF